MNIDSFLPLIAIFLILAFSAASFGWFEEWGREPSGEPRRDGQLGYPPMRWKDWKSWTWFELLFSPVMAAAYLGVGIFGLAAAIMGAAIYLIFLNPICIIFWKKFLTILAKPIGANS